MVRVGFFDLLPMAVATRLLSLEAAMLSRDLECLMEGNAFISGVGGRLEELDRLDGTSLRDFDRDHQDLDGGGIGKADMTEKEEGASGEGE